MSKTADVMIVGPGVMGRALAGIFIAKGWRGKIELVAKSKEQAEEVRRILPEKVKVGPGYDFSFLEDYKVVILALKPQQLPEYCQGLAGKFSDKMLVISIAAGVSIKSLSGWLKHEKIIRAMPNTPAQIGQGTTVWMFNQPAWSPAGSQLAKEIFSCWGTEYMVSREELIDVATATAGSMPAYLGRFAQGIITAAVKNGFPRQLAKELVLEAMAGSLAMIKQRPGKSLADFCEDVISPGGTTAQAMHVLEQRAFIATLTEAIEAALERVRQLAEAFMSK